MRIFILLCLALTAGPLPAGARVIRIWPRDDLLAAADLAVIGMPVAGRDLAETNSLGWSSTATFQSRFRGVETTFHITDVLKGSPATDLLVLHHYRYEPGWGCPPNGPCLASPEPTDTNPWVLFLVKDATGQYAPVTGQADSALSVRPLTPKYDRTAGLAGLPTRAGLTLTSSNDAQLSAQISAILAGCQRIQPGMTRADLLPEFTTEGGLSTARQRTYVYRRCPLIKVQVDFAPADPSMRAENPGDTIVNVSKPYLEWSIAD